MFYELNDVHPHVVQVCVIQFGSLYCVWDYLGSFLCF